MVDITNFQRHHNCHIHQTKIAMVNCCCWGFALLGIACFPFKISLLVGYQEIISPVKKETHDVGGRGAFDLGGWGPTCIFCQQKSINESTWDETMLPMNLPQMCFVKHDPERKLKMIVIKLVWGCLSVKYSKPCEGGPHLPFIYTI